MKTKLSMLLTAVCVTVFYPSFTLAQSTPPNGPPPWDWPGPGHMWGGGWGFGWIFFPLIMLFMIVVFVAIFLLGHRMFGGHHYRGRPWHMMDAHSPNDPTYTALQLLNERYAKGEIQKGEYQEKKAAILSRG